jgi:hypothetical protein
VAGVLYRRRQASLALRNAYSTSSGGL